jgi:hypothetical protein
MSGNAPTGHYAFCIAAGFATNGRYRESSLGENLPSFNETGHGWGL